MGSKTFSETKAMRNYDITLVLFSRCDLCKRYWKKAFELIPETRLHTFDTIILCKECLSRCDFHFTVDLKDVVEYVNKEE